MRRRALATVAALALAAGALTPSPARAADGPSWLAAEAPAAAPISRTGKRLALGAGAIALVAGAGALVARRRRSAASLAPSLRPLSIVASTRVSPTAEVVVVDVGGKRLVLAVDARGVRRLATFRGEGARRAAAPSTAPSSTSLAPDAATLPSPPIASARAEETPAATPAHATFGDALRAAARSSSASREGAASVALAASQSVVDVVERRRTTPRRAESRTRIEADEPRADDTPSPAPRATDATAADLEEQVSGLGRRPRRRA